MSDTEAVLFANEAFYAAFARRDADAMDDVWASRDAVTCVHPGWPPIGGRDQVIESWRAILGNPDSPTIRASHATAQVLNDVAYVVCYESFDEGFMVATNLFVRQGKAWAMVHHQAGMAPRPADQDVVNAQNTFQ